MIWKQPNKVKFTDMAIFIDSHKDINNLSISDQETVYKYMYFIMRMLAYKNRWFNNLNLYDDYAVYSANYLYFRYKNNSSLIKNFLSYAKKSAYDLKLNFDKIEYGKNYNKEILDDDYQYEYTFAEDIRDSIKCFKLIELQSSIESVEVLIKQFLYKLPFDKNSKLWQEIYISCLFTIIYMIENRKPQLSLDCVRLFHLTDSYKEYILLLVKEIMYITMNEFDEIINTYDINDN